MPSPAPAILRSRRALGAALRTAALPDSLSFFPRGSSAVSLLGALALGCGAAAEPLSGIYPMPPGDEDGCTPALTAITTLDEPTALGFTALEALTRLAGPRSSALEWREPAPNDEYELTLGPERGRSTLDLDLRVREGTILHRFRTPLLTAPDDTTCDPGAIEIPITVTLQSGAQGLTESFDAVLEARAPYRGHISARLEPGALRGGLGLAHVMSLDPARTFWLRALRVEADVWEGGSAGALSVELGASHAKPPSQPSWAPVAPAQPDSIAAWPSSIECDEAGEALPTDAKVLGFSVDDVLEELGRSGPRQVTWSDGDDAQLVLELGAAAPELCQAVGESLSFTALVRARSDAGGIDVRSPVRIEAFDAGGQVGAIHIESADPNAPYPLADSARRARPASDGYSAVLVGLEWNHDGERDSGSLSLRGVDAAAPDASGVYPSTALANARW